MFRKILLTLLAVVVLCLAGFAIYVTSRQHLTFDAPYPAVAASADPAVIARGRYVVRSLTNCAMCHGDTTRRAARDAGEEVALCGGNRWDIPPGQFFARNITPDPATGIGRIPDRALARALRYGVGHDGRALLPFMELQGLSDEDLTAVISYLRSRPPVHNPIPAHRPNLLGQVILATVLAHPVGPAAPPPGRNPHGATIENGRYLAESAALCWGCHTQRDPNTGALVGPRFAGATGFVEESDRSRTWSPPNLTRDPETGLLGRWSEDVFVARFRTGRVIPGSPMPWQGYARLDEDDLRAIYRYLRTLPPVKHDVGPPMVVVAKQS